MGQLKLQNDLIDSVYVNYISMGFSIKLFI